MDSLGAGPFWPRIVGRVADSAEMPLPGPKQDQRQGDRLRGRLVCSCGIPYRVADQLGLGAGKTK
jgi:hypothetical protein